MDWKSLLAALCVYSPRTPTIKCANYAESRRSNWDNAAEVGASSHAEDGLVCCLLLRTLADSTRLLPHTWDVPAKKDLPETAHKHSAPINKNQKNVVCSSRETLIPLPSITSVCLMSQCGLRDNIYPVKAMMVTFCDVTHPPASSSEMPLGSMPSFPEPTRDETLWCPSPAG